MEQSCAVRLRTTSARVQFLRIRLTRRRILGGYLGIAPERVLFGQGPQGKPYIAWPQPAPHFNLTHSGPLCLLAVCWDGELGLDLEQIRPRSGALAIAQRLFASGVAAQLTGAPAEMQTALFHYHWTRLEAGVKARGGGLFEPASRNPSGLTFMSFVPAPGFQGCIAARKALPSPAHWRTLVLRPASG